ncbi:MAG TPA: HEAT repeat domain-containing protein [Phycisphaerae bacterium]|nr:HEAT repeat domain-containing protein [Phycisphaerae bacterium]
MPMYVIIVLTALTALAAQAVQAAEAPQVPGAGPDGRYRKWEDDAVFVEVHRSMRLVAPENSMAAARDCYLAGGDAIDGDVRHTLDGVVICFHDGDPSRRGSAMFYPIPQLTWAEVRTVLIEPLTYPGSAETIPCFEDVLRRAIANNMAVYLDPKSPPGMSGARSLMSRYGASHLGKFPRWPLVYYWTSRGDHDLAALKALLGPGTFKDIRGKVEVKLQAGDPRCFRVDDPRVMVAMLGRRPEKRGPWREPVPPRPDTRRDEPLGAEALRAALGKPHPDSRLAAAALCERFPEQAAAAATAMLTDDKTPPAERVEALWMLGQLGQAASAPVLKGHLSCSDPRQRELAAYGLGRLKRPEALDDLLGRLDDEDSMAAAAAAWAAWRIGQDRAAGPVVQALRRRLEAGREGDEQAVRMLLLAAGSLRAAPAVAVIEGGMTGKAQGANVNMAIAALGAIGGPEAVAAARKLLDAHGRLADGHTFCRAMTVAGKDGTGQLVEALAGEDSRVVMDATLTLAAVPDAPAVLARFLAAGKLSPAARVRAVAAMVLNPAPDAEHLLKTLAADPDPAAAAGARWALTARRSAPAAGPGERGPE